MSKEDLFHALEIGDLSTVKSLMPSKFPTDTIFKIMREFGSHSFPQNHTALMIASKYGYLEMVKYLVEKGADVNERHLLDYWTALMFASGADHLNIVKYLVEHGAELDLQDARGYTALMWARGHFDIIKYLVEKGADVTLRDSNSGWTILVSSIVAGDMGTMKYLIERETNLPTKKGILSYFTKFWETPVPNSFNYRHEYGNTTLMFAVTYDRPQIAKFLIDHIYQVSKREYLNVEDSRGQTALMMTATETTRDRNEKLELAKILVEAGAPINYRNRFGETALVLASKNEHANIVKYLLEQGADSSIRDRNNKTAYEYGNDEIKLIFYNFKLGKIDDLRKDKTTYINVIPKDLYVLIKYELGNQEK